MPQFVLIALATLVTEDLTCVATGVLIAQGRLSFAGGMLACLAGIYFGDLLLFAAGRLLGRPALRWRLLRRFLAPEQIDRASEWLGAQGAAVVLLSRFAPGLRLPTYFAAGLLRTSLWKFSAYFLLAAAIWTPLLVGLAALAGGPAARTAVLAGGGGATAVVASCALWIFARKLMPVLLSFPRRRKLAGFLMRKVRWEFWPPWAAYLPLVPYLAWLAIRHRSLTVFTAANPGMPAGGFVGESKSQILAHLSRADGRVAEYALIPGSLTPAARIRAAGVFLRRRERPFPVVLKPDVGERGAGVSIIGSHDELAAYLRAATGDTIIQEYVDGPEFGVFYYRYPNQRTGRIVSITEKTFPAVTGDGRSTLEELILRDRRAVCLASTYLARSKRPARSVPEPGERVPLVEIGSHCRGAVFRDGRHLTTAALEAAIDEVSKRHPGFFFGRFDVRAPSLADFQEGAFRVLELNGVTAEPTHIYDPSVSLAEAYRTLCAQWRIAFEIGAANRRSGASGMSAFDLLGLVRSRGGRTAAMHA